MTKELHGNRPTKVHQKRWNLPVGKNTSSADLSMESTLCKFVHIITSCGSTFPLVHFPRQPWSAPSICVSAVFYLLQWWIAAAADSFRLKHVECLPFPGCFLRGGSRQVWSFFVFRRMPLTSILSQIKPVHNFLNNFFMILFNIVLSSKLKAYKWSHSYKFSDQNFVSFFLTFLCMVYILPDLIILKTFCED